MQSPENTKYSPEPPWAITAKFVTKENKARGIVYIAPPHPHPYTHILTHSHNTIIIAAGPGGCRAMCVVSPSSPSCHASAAAGPSNRSPFVINAAAKLPGQRISPSPNNYAHAKCKYIDRILQQWGSCVVGVAVVVIVAVVVFVVVLVVVVVVVVFI